MDGDKQDDTNEPQDTEDDDNKPKAPADWDGFKGEIPDKKRRQR